MRRAATLALALTTAGLGACAAPTVRPSATIEPPPPPPPTGWRAIATAADQARLQALPATWARARAAVPPRRRAKLSAERELVDPAVALELPAPPPGPYQCRLIRFGGRAGFATFPPDFCYVDGNAEGLSFTKQTGSNLPGGWIHPDTPTRQVFLGSTPRMPKAGVPRYGDDPAQDVAGVVERVSPFRWRLVLTRAKGGALLDVYELVPVPPTVPGPAPAAAARAQSDTPARTVRRTTRAKPAQQEPGIMPVDRPRPQ